MPEVLDYQQEPQTIGSKPVLTFENLYDKIHGYIFENAVLPPLLFDVYARNKKDVVLDIDITTEELMWLQYNIGVINKIVNNKTPTIMIFYLNRSRFQSFSTREMAKKTGETEQKINRWARFLLSKKILSFRRLNYDNKTYYILNGKFKTLQKIILNLVLESKSPKELSGLLIPSKESVTRIQERKRKMREAFKRSYRKKKYITRS